MLADFTPSPRVKRKRYRPRITPAGLRGPDAARYVGVSPAAWARLVAAGKTPRPIRLSGCVLWSRHELTRWLDANCPDLVAWEAIRAAERRR
jgi:predicted DNA-binding transcriptional regulator AlpA